MTITSKRLCEMVDQINQICTFEEGGEVEEAVIFLIAVPLDEGESVTWVHLVHFLLYVE